MSKQTLSALANHGQTTIHTSPAISNTTGQGQTTSSTLNALIFEHSMGGINIATALPKQTYGKTNITDTSNMQPTKFSMNKAKLTPFETQLLAQAKAAAEKKADKNNNIINNIIFIQILCSSKIYYTFLLFYYN